MEKKNIINLNTDLLSDYLDFERVNSDWNIGKYLNFNYSLNDALAFSKFFFPTFIFYKGCVVLEDRFDKETFELWFDKFNGEVSKIEKMCNLYELKDFFHINSEDNSIERLKQLGIILQQSWRINLDKLFPQISFEIIVFEEFEELFITIYSR